MVFLAALEGATDFVLNSEVVDFIVEGATKILGVMTTPPLGTFLTIGIIGGVVGLVATIVRMVKR